DTASFALWRDRYGQSRHDADGATRIWPKGNKLRRRAAWQYATVRRRSSRVPGIAVRQEAAAALSQERRQLPARGVRAGIVLWPPDGSTTARRRDAGARHRLRRVRRKSGLARSWRTHRA